MQKTFNLDGAGRFYTMLNSKLLFHVSGTMVFDLSKIDQKVIDDARRHIKRGYVNKSGGKGYDLAFYICNLAGVRLSSFNSDRILIRVPDLNKTEDIFKEFKTLTSINGENHIRDVFMNTGKDSVIVSLGGYLDLRKAIKSSSTTKALLDKYMKEWKEYRQDALDLINGGEIVTEYRFDFKS